MKKNKRKMIEALVITGSMLSLVNLSNRVLAEDPPKSDSSKTSISAQKQDPQQITNQQIEKETTLLIANRAFQINNDLPLDKKSAELANFQNKQELIEQITKESPEEDFDLAKKLIPIIDKKTVNGETFLTQLIRDQKPDPAIKYYLACGGELKVRNDRKETPLMIATKNNDLNLVKLLMSYGDAGVIFSDQQKNFPIMVALKNNNLEILKVLLSRSATKYVRNLQKENPLMIAIRTGNLELVKCLLNSGCDPNVGVNALGEVALSLAVKENNLALIKLLLSFGADPHPKLSNLDARPLNQARKMNNQNLINLLNKFSDNPNLEPEQRELLLVNASQDHDLDLVKSLFEASDQKETLLFNLLKNNNLDLFKLLINFQSRLPEEQQAGLDDHDQNGNTMLYYAITGRNKELITTLINAGASIHVKNSNGQTSLAIAMDLGIGSLLPLQAELPETNYLLQNQTHLRTTVPIEQSDGTLQIPDQAIIHQMDNGNGTANSTTTDYTNQKLFESGISFDDIKQGDAGDCYLLTALGSIAQQQPELIKNMIKDNGDGTVTVRLYNHDQPFYYQISKKLINDLGAADSALWVRLIEKAYAAHTSIFRQHFRQVQQEGEQLVEQAQEQLVVTEFTTKNHEAINLAKQELLNTKQQLLLELIKTQKSDYENNDVDPKLFKQEISEQSYQYLNQGFLRDALHYLIGSTGLDPTDQITANSFILLPLIDEEETSTSKRANIYSDQLATFHQKLLDAFYSQNYVMTCGLASNHNQSGFLASHEYQVIGFNNIETATGEVIRTIEIRNPWGENTPHYVEDDLGKFKLIVSDDPSRASCVIDFNDFAKLFQISISKLG